ncbi:MAG: hypothetical protein HXY23_08160 [Parvularculaceae bacterium]|nr:hypothetical protein [Parvularculaceae bacterium]
MIDFRYAAGQIDATLRMAQNRPGWTDGLDRSVDGVFRSFAAMALAAPFLAVNAAAGRVAAQETDALTREPIVTAPLAAFLPIQLVAAYADWFATLALLAFIARAVGASRRAAELIAGYNWIQLPLVGLQSIPAAAILMPGESSLAAVLVLPVIAIAMALLWGYLRRALALEPAWTLLLLILLTLVGLVAQNLASSIGFGLYRLFA